MKKIIIIIPNKHFFSKYKGVGGHITHLLGVIEGFRENNFEINLVCDNEIKNFFSLDQVKVHGITSRKTPSLIFLFLVFLKSYRLSKNFGGVFYIRYSASYVPLLALFSKLIGRTKAYVEVNSFGSQYKSWFGFFDKWLLNCKYEFICISQSVVNHAFNLKRTDKLFDKNKFKVVENGVSKTRFIEFKTQSNYDCLVYVGVLKPGYGLEEMIQSYQDSSLIKSNVSLKIIGDGPSRNALEAKYNYPGVEFSGAIPFEQVPDYIKKLNGVFIYPGIGMFTFQSPIKLYEYMALGKPIISTQTTQTANVLDQGELGILCDINDHNSLKSSWLEIKNNVSKWNAISKKAQDKALNHYTWAMVVERILKSNG